MQCPSIWKGTERESWFKNVNFFFYFSSQYNYMNNSIEIHPVFLYFINQTFTSTIKNSIKYRNNNNHQHQSSGASPFKPSTRPRFLHFITYLKKRFQRSTHFARLNQIHRLNWRMERDYFEQADHLYPYYLILSLLTTLIIIAIRYLSLYATHKTDFWLSSSMVTSYAGVGVALTSLVIYLFFVQKPVSCNWNWTNDWT